MVNFRKSNMIVTSFKGYKNPKKIHADFCDYFGVPKGADIIVKIDDCISDLEELLSDESNNENANINENENEGPKYSSETLKIANKIFVILKNAQNEVEYVWLDY